VGVLVRLTGGYKGDKTVETRTDENGRYEIGVFEHASFYLILPAPAEGACEGSATYSHPQYKAQTIREGWFGSASFDGPCGRVRRDVWLLPMPSNSRLVPDNFRMALRAQPVAAQPGR
jgi:hypothetical protein